MTKSYGHEMVTVVNYGISQRGSRGKEGHFVVFKVNLVRIVYHI